MDRDRPWLRGAVAVVATVVLAACGGDDGDDAAETTTTTTPVTTAPPVEGPGPDAVAVGWAELSAGDCFEPVDDPDATDLAVWRVDCTEPHRYEVYDVVALDVEVPIGGGYPGAEAIRDRAEELCVERFEAFIGVRWTVSELDLQAWWPSENSWARGDDTVICAVMELSGEPMTGTQRGAAR